MPDYDLILKGGTVLDPRNGFDDGADLAVRNGRVEAVEPEIDPDRADEVVDVSGLWVMPGQIDTHAHVAGLFGSWDSRSRLRDARPRGHDHGDGHGRHRGVAHRRHQAARSRTQRGRELRSHPRTDHSRGTVVQVGHSGHCERCAAAGLHWYQDTRRV